MSNPEYFKFLAWVEETEPSTQHKTDEQWAQLRLAESLGHIEKIRGMEDTCSHYFLTDNGATALNEYYAQRQIERAQANSALQDALDTVLRENHELRRENLALQQRITELTAVANRLLENYTYPRPDDYVECIWCGEEAGFWRTDKIQHKSDCYVLEAKTVLSNP